jgi:hypothetical protein
MKISSVLIPYIINDSDPYFSREILFFFLALGILPLGFFSGERTYTDQFMISAAGNVYYSISFMYVIILSANNARQLELGSLTFLMTMPIKKNQMLALRIILPSFITSTLFLAIFAIFIFYSSFGFHILLLFVVYITSLSMLFMYLSIGYFLSYIFRNSVVTFLAMILILVIELSYTQKILSMGSPFNVFVMGVFALKGSDFFSAGTLFGVTLEALSGFTVLLCHCYALKHFNLRSGR